MGIPGFNDKRVGAMTVTPNIEFYRWTWCDNSRRRSQPWAYIGKGIGRHASRDGCRSAAASGNKGYEATELGRQKSQVALSARCSNRATESDGPQQDGTGSTVQKPLWVLSTQDSNVQFTQWLKVSWSGFCPNTSLRPLAQAEGNLNHFRYASDILGMFLTDMAQHNLN